jgi:hypothetical protein
MKQFPPHDPQAVNGAALTDEFFALWLPFELEIGRLTQAVSGVVEESDVSKEVERLQKRRLVLENLFAAASTGDAEAQRTVEALGEVMRLFGARVTRLVERSELVRGQEPGQTALEQLARETEFLQRATAYTTRLHSWLLDGFSAASTGKAGKTVLGPRPVELPAELRFLNDSIHRGAVTSLAQVANWGEIQDFAFGMEQTIAKASVVIGLPNGEKAQDLWEFLRGGGARLVKAHYALWARYYEDVEDGGMRYVMVSVPQFCSDIGLKKHHKGGFRPEQKRQALQMLKALTSIEMSVSKVLGRKERRLRGPLWARGFEAQERDVYSDLLGQAREGREEDWEPVAFSFAPGPWFEDPEWRKYHKYVGKIGSGLLRLSGDNDQWAILIGGYLGTLGRTNGYKPLRLRVGTILSNSGLAQTEDAKRRVKQNRAKLEVALNRLADSEIGVISDWRFVDMVVDEPDMDDPDSLSAYGAANPYPPGDWRGWIVEISLPFEKDQIRLEQQRAKAIATKKPRLKPKKSE